MTAGSMALALGCAASRAVPAEAREGGAPEPGPLDLVDPELRPALERYASLRTREPTLAHMQRGAFAPATPLPLPAPPQRLRTIAAASGQPDVPLAIVDGAPGEAGKGALIFLHGGGFVRGAHDVQADFLQGIALACRCLVVSVGYRLAPGTVFPGALDDCYAALVWLHRNAGDLGVDRARIAVGGTSAGAGHAATLAIAARDRDEYRIAFQLLIQPMLDDRTGSGRQVPPHLGAFIWGPEMNAFGWSAMLGRPAGSPRVAKGPVPARVEDLSGLPPAWIGVGAIDLFLGESADYATRLAEAGVPVELEIVAGAYHGFDRLVPDAKVSAAFRAGWQAALRRAIGPRA